MRQEPGRAIFVGRPRTGGLLALLALAWACGPGTARARANPLSLARSQRARNRLSLPLRQPIPAMCQARTLARPPPADRPRRRSALAPAADAHRPCRRADIASPRGARPAGRDRVRRLSNAPRGHAQWQRAAAAAQLGPFRTARRRPGSRASRKIPTTTRRSMPAAARPVHLAAHAGHALPLPARRVDGL